MGRKRREGWRLLAALSGVLLLAGCGPQAEGPVSRPPEEVYAALLQLERYPEWLPTRFTNVEVRPEGTDSIPHLYFEMELPGVMVPQTLRVVGSTPGREVVLASPPDAVTRMEMRWTIAPAGEGSLVSVEYSLRGDRSLIVGPISETFQSAAAESVYRLNAALQAGARGPGAEP